MLISTYCSCSVNSSLDFKNFKSRTQEHTTKNTHLFCTYFVNWYLFCTLNFSSLNNLFFLIVIDTCEEKLALWYIVKYDSVEWLLTDCFFDLWSDTVLGHVWAVTIFVRKKQVHISPHFSRLLIQFSKTVLAA